MLNKKKYWLPDEQEVYCIGELESTNEDTCSIKNLKNQNNCKVKVKDQMEVDEQCFIGIEDLLTLQELNEGNFLKNLNVRYERNDIYTCIGESIVISINPFKKLKIYDIEKFQQNINNVKAHLYKITANSLKSLEDFQTSQSIIISGESGSGKTESTKIILNYISEYDRKKDSQTGNLEQNLNNKVQKKSIQEQIVENNHILEAFGNAKTVRNDNSSRFGKFIKVFIGDDMRIKSANIINYLLEKSRVTKIAAQERNYHIFYQIIRGGSPQFRQKYHLKNIESYVYLTQGDTYTNLDDENNFQQVLKCLEIMKFSDQQINSLFSIVSAILQLGNINLFSINDHQSQISDDDEYLQYAALLLQLQSKDILKKVICNPMIYDPSAKKNIEINQSVQQLLYGSMFDWIIEQINQTLNQNRENTYETTKNRLSQNSKNNLNNIKKIENSYPFYKENNIAILDIFGFEIFQENSFEQLCINYANEKLQFQFNENMFKAEQKEYEEEGIAWSHVDFVDNQNTIDLFELKSGCIFNYLDDECKRNDGNDSRFMNQVRNNLSKQPAIIFNNSKNPRNASLFSIKHFAGQVEYDTNGFVDKNRDSANQNIINLLASTQNIILKQKFPQTEESEQNNNSQPTQNNSNQPSSSLFQNSFKQFNGSKNTGNSNQSNVVAAKKTTLATQFKQQLNTLMGELNTSMSFYVRCIKPNTEKVDNYFNHNEVQRQIKCAGLLEAIKIRKCGFSLRFNHRDFLMRYNIVINQLLTNNLFVGKSPGDKCSSILEIVLRSQKNNQPKTKNKNEEKLYAIGKNKVFLKEQMRDLLEAELKRINQEKAIIIQKYFRRYNQQKKYQHQKTAVIKIQRSYRYRLFRKEMQNLIYQREQEILRQEQIQRELEERLRIQEEQEQKERDRLQMLFEEAQREKSQQHTTNVQTNGLSQYIQQHAESNPFLRRSSYEYEEVNQRQQYNKGAEQYNENNRSSNSFIQQIEYKIRNQNPDEMFGEDDHDDDDEDYEDGYINKYKQNIQYQSEFNQDKNNNYIDFSQPAYKNDLNVSKSNITGNNIHDVSEIIQGTLLSSQKENEILEILKQKCKVFCQQELMSFSLYHFITISSTINNFLQCTQIQIIEQLKKIMTLENQIQAQNKLLQEKDIIENSLERKLDNNILNNAIENEKLNQEIAKLQDKIYQLEQESSNNMKLSKNDEQQLIFSKNSQQKLEDMERENQFLKKQLDNIKQQLNQQDTQMKAIQKMNEQQRAEISQNHQHKMQLEQSQSNDKIEMQRLIKTCKKLQEKDKYNETVIESVFNLLKDKNEELELIKKSVQGMNNLKIDSFLLNQVINKQEDSLQKLKSIYKENKHPL